LPIQFACIAYPEFAFDVLSVRVNRVATEMQLSGNRSTGQSLANHPENLQFTIGKQFRWLFTMA